MAKRGEQKQERFPATEEDIPLYVEAKAATTRQLMSREPTEEELEAWEAEARALVEGDQEATRDLEKRTQAELERPPTPYFEDFDDAMLHYGDGEGVVTVDDYEKLDDKEDLIGVPFMIVQFWFSEGEIVDPVSGNLREYATLKVVTKETTTKPSAKYTVVDGSTGIYKQLKEINKRTGKWGGILARNGLRVSHYRYEGAPASTFYLT